ncbi:MAG: VWA domain-containing protein [Myxococcales bacterium]|nr:VWA domain-containing protein [Myxococcales bacterium]
MCALLLAPAGCNKDNCSFIGGCTANSDDAGTAKGDGGVSPLPCSGPNPDPACKDTCSKDEDCKSGFYCGGTGVCTADCNADGKRCAATSRCNERGLCVNAQTGCPDVAVSLAPVVPNVMLVIDQSGSMTDNFGRINNQRVNRWEAVHYALTDQTEGIVSKLQDRVRFGATLYHSEGGNQGGQCPILAKSPGTPAGQPVLNNRNAIDQLFTNNSPNRDTPTAESINAVVADLQSWSKSSPDDPSPNIIVLATDGDPDNCTDADAHNAASQQMSETAVQNAFSAGITTYVLSVGSDVTVSHLEKLANAGVGKTLTPADAPFYRGNDPQQLIDAFSKIIGGVRTCSFTLSGAVTDAASGTVLLDGQKLTYKTDWELTDQRTMKLLGQACQTFLDKASVTLEARFPCGTVIN